MAENKLKNIPSSILPDSTPITRLANLIAHPPYDSIPSSLLSMSSSEDTANMRGSISQSFTSWNVSSRSFVSSICYAGLEAVAPEKPILASVQSTASDLNVNASGPERIRMLTEPVNTSSSAPPAKVSTWYSDTLPVRVVSYTPWHYDWEHNLNFPRPYSPLFKAMKKLLTDPDLPEGPIENNTIHDVWTILSLSKYLLTEMGPTFEVAPLVRLGCMSLSISEQCYKTEIVTRRIIRGFEQTAYLGCEITQEKRRTPVSFILACSLETFTNFVCDDVTSMDPDNIFNKDQCDKMWIAVPISNKCLNQRSAVPYIASFMSSEFYNGKVNHVYRGYYSDAERNNKTEAVIRTIPAANSVFLQGSKNVILVLTDNKELCTDSIVKLLNFNVPVYTGAAQVKPVQFGEIWDAWWCNDMLRNIDGDVISAMNEVKIHLAVKDAVDIATSLLAELYSAAYLGIAVEPNQDSKTYNWQEPVRGGWSLYRNDTIAQGSRAKLNYWSTADGEDQENARRRIAGYNFSALTSWHRPSSDMVCTESQTSRFLNAGQMRVWSSTTPLGGIWIPGYYITTLNSIKRICFYVKLLLADGNEMPYYNLGSPIHLLSVIMGAQTSLMFSQTNLSLSVWSGYGTNGENRYFNETMIKTLMKVATRGISNFIGHHILKDHYDIYEYYGINPFNNENWFSYTPYPHHFVQQWSAKTNMVIGKYEYLLSKDTLQYRSKIACTINADEYFPMVVYQSSSDQPSMNMMAWVDNWSYLSNISVVENVWVNVLGKANLESNELVLPMVDNIDIDDESSKIRYDNKLTLRIVDNMNCVVEFKEVYFSEITWYQSPFMTS